MTDENQRDSELEAAGKNNIDNGFEVLRKRKKESLRRGLKVEEAKLTKRKHLYNIDD